MVPVVEVLQRGGILLSNEEFQQYLGSLFSKAASCLLFCFALVEYDSTSRPLCTCVEGPRPWQRRTNTQVFYLFPAVAPLKGH